MLPKAHQRDGEVIRQVIPPTSPLASGHSTTLQVARAGHYGAAAINRKESIIVRSLDVAHKVLRAGTTTSRMFLPTTYLIGHFS